MLSAIVEFKQAVVWYKLSLMNPCRSSTIPLFLLSICTSWVKGGGKGVNLWVWKSCRKRAMRDREYVHILETKLEETLETQSNAGTLGGLCAII